MNGAIDKQFLISIALRNTFKNIPRSCMHTGEGRYAINNMVNELTSNLLYATIVNLKIFHTNEVRLRCRRNCKFWLRKTSKAATFHGDGRTT
ncbi:hypothetical protein EVAR_11750_1 [Eumeta japonica]|uniref:Uncharacterized protein n=1 Tax=Eumeta variegata TaxID=151549 RepID=A0A4C1UP95_EUMVA|nr:hypothetical protein EVAR_11750_1 [Eumeta japonica]